MRILSIAIISWTFLVVLSNATPERYASGIPSLDAFLASKHLSDEQVVVGMTGFYGQDQPHQWLILTQGRDSSEILEEWVVCDGVVQGKRRIRKLPMQDLPTIPIVREKLRVDSDKAFVTAEKLAEEARIGYDSVHYQLRCRDAAHEPVWVVNMLDPAGRSVGIHYISAETGQTLRSVWHRTGATSVTRADETDGKPESLLYGGTVREITLSGNLGRQKREVSRIISPKNPE